MIALKWTLLAIYAIGLIGRVENLRRGQPNPISDDPRRYRTIEAIAMLTTVVMMAWVWTALR